VSFWSIFSRVSFLKHLFQSVFFEATFPECLFEAYFLECLSFYLFPIPHHLNKISQNQLITNKNHEWTRYPPK
jgi:hypothetical protein